MKGRKVQTDEVLADGMSQQEDRHLGRDLLGHVAAIEVLVLKPDLPSCMHACHSTGTLHPHR